MQKMLEEYGGVIHIVIAIIALVVICGIVIGGSNGGVMKKSLDDMVASLSEDDSSGSIVTETSSNVVKRFMTEDGDYSGEYILADVTNGTGIKVKEVIFHKSYKNLDVVDDYEAVSVNNGKAVDIGTSGDGSVVAYLTGETEDAVLNIAGKDGVIMAGDSLAGLLAGFEDLEKVSFNGCLNTSNTTSLVGLFANCCSLKEVDLSGFDTSNVTNMGAMFSECYALKDIKLKNIDTSKVEIMESMFSNCESLLSFDLSNFDTRNVVYAGGMFYGCDSLKHLDLSNFETPKLENCACMFQNCDALEYLDISGLNMTSVTEADRMFADCVAMKEILVGEGWNNLSESALKTNMFRNCGVAEVTPK